MSKYQQYESEKRALQYMGLSAEEYEKAVKALAKKYNI